MKCIVLLLLCASTLAVPSGYEVAKEHADELQETNNPIDTLFKEALEFIRKLLQTYEPFEVPDMPEQTISGDGISLKAKFSHVKVSKASSFVIDHLENHIIGLWAIFNVTIPQMHIEGDYTVSGTINGKAVKSTKDGHFEIDVEQLKTGGYIKVAFQATYLQMSQMDLTYTVKGLKFNQTGLEVDGMSEQELKNLINDRAFLKYFQDNEEFVCKQISDYVKETANKIMYEKSLQGLLDWLKDVIDGKIIPTPPTDY